MASTTCCLLSIASLSLGLAMPLAPARADDGAGTGQPSSVGVFNAVVENDLVTNTDKHYTSGIRLSYVTPQTSEPAWAEGLAARLPLFGTADNLRFEVGLGQSLFTPRDITDRRPAADQRPYAAWLYGAVGLIAERGMHLDRIQLSLGVVGPAALGEETQSFVHELIGADDPKGWDTQLENEPSVQLTYQHNWRSLVSERLLGMEWDATPHLGGALGNVFIYGNAGITLRVGQNLPVDFGPPRIDPGLPGSGFFEPAGRLGWYIFAGVDGRAVARNLFLDGNTLRESREVDKKPFVGDLQAGVAVTFGSMRLAYAQVLRTREFDGQDEADSFGALSLSLRF